MWGFIVAGGVAVGFTSLWARYVAPIRRLSKHLRADEVGITIGAGDRIPWSNVREVRVETTAAGPYFEDFYIVLEIDRRRPVRIPEPLAPRVLRDIQKLPGFDSEALLRGVGSTAKAVFPCWKRGVSAQ